MSSLLDMKVASVVDDYFRSAEFNDWLGLRIRWSMQGFEPGFAINDRERFTDTVARRIRRKSRRPVYLCGFRVLRLRERWEVCEKEAERIVTDFLREERIKFGDPRFCWKDGADLADADMDYWESCP